MLDDEMFQSCMAAILGVHEPVDVVNSYEVHHWGPAGAHGLGEEALSVQANQLNVPFLWFKVIT